MKIILILCLLFSSVSFGMERIATELRLMRKFELTKELTAQIQDLLKQK